MLGEYNRQEESGFEQRIPVDKIILHDAYQNFRNDLVLMKLSRPARMTLTSKIRTICLPFADIKVNTMFNTYAYDDLNKYPDSIRDNNNLRNLKFNNSYDLANSSANTITTKLIQENLIRNNNSRRTARQSTQRDGRKLHQPASAKNKRRNDKFSQGVFLRNLYEPPSPQQQDNEVFNEDYT